MKLDWRNVIENLIYIIAIGTMLIISNNVTIARFEPMIDAAIKQETTAIKNEFRTEIKKLKAKDGAAVDLQISPDLDNKAQTIIEKDSNAPKKKGFFGRLFGGKD